MKRVKNGLIVSLIMVLAISFISCGTGAKNNYPSNDDIVQMMSERDSLFGLPFTEIYSFTTEQTKEENGILYITGNTSYTIDGTKKSEKMCTVEYTITDNGEYIFKDVYGNY